MIDDPTGPIAVRLGALFEPGERKGSEDERHLGEGAAGVARVEREWPEWLASKEGARARRRAAV